MSNFLSNKQWEDLEVYCSQLAVTGREAQAQAFRRCLHWFKHSPPHKIIAITPGMWKIEFDTEAEAAHWIKICSSASSSNSVTFSQTGAIVIVEGV
ncbi:hypothetical protein [Pseudanabaena sp. FACHB-2040]|uniref:hypothetical protein n=1 Tax=Pseudanabaena sp. FACHB-2040 TaxID=2692859 RepID=UPI001689BE4F|nr:hypothetical protein [Pseudanabaena sp. FACHB-2040]MBD0267320.1 hypothetical protein [Cyanobacteria bacterium Co-bin8]MBD2256884.1 hypothetical protein [Pseudanabaena sp. FACHB-2040]